MDSNNWRSPQAEPAVDAGDWRSQLQPDSRKRIVNKMCAILINFASITYYSTVSQFKCFRGKGGEREREKSRMETLKRHLPFSGQEGLHELRKIIMRFEEKIYTEATSQSDYLRKISLKMLTMESKSQNNVPNAIASYSTGISKNQQDPASLDSTAQTGNNVDWQEEVYQKIKAMKELYYADLNEMYQKISFKLQQHDSVPQQPQTQQLEKLRIFKHKLEKLMQFLQLGKSNISPAQKEKLGSYEKQVITFLNSNRPRKPAISLQARI